MNTTSVLLALLSSAFVLSACGLHDRIDRAFGYPSSEERAPMAGRLARLKQSPVPGIAVYPVRRGRSVDKTAAEQLVAEINRAGLAKASLAADAPQFDIKPGHNEARMLWDVAREFRAYLKKTPPAAPYALYADYFANFKAGKVGAVHLVLCDRDGEWVHVDFQNSHQANFKTVNPHTLADCTRLAAMRLEHAVK
jgi:hypothetical protein